MRVLSGLLIGLVLAATAVHSHEPPSFDWPIPEVERVFLVDDVYTAFQWSGNDLSEHEW